VTHSKKSAAARKPHPAFALWIHASHKPEKARWCKRVRGRFHYFGKDDGRWASAPARMTASIASI
jgi:hypothetical protein